MSIADALSTAQLAIVQAEAAVTLDTGTGEASAALGTAQAGVAYQLVIQILQDKVVELAPALIAVEIAAINQGIAAYLAEQELSTIIERDVEAKTASAFEDIQANYDADSHSVSTEFQVEIIRESLTYNTALESGSNLSAAIEAVLAEVDAAVRLALETAASTEL
ncbi:MAG TPA: hypothetical protein DC047_13450 [Blastocatellia bacterium]|nr:hypothetical protein [Blastocatellia bacterium]